MLKNVSKPVSNIIPEEIQSQAPLSIFEGLNDSSDEEEKEKVQPPPLKKKASYVAKSLVKRIQEAKTLPSREQSIVAVCKVFLENGVNETVFNEAAKFFQVLFSLLHQLTLI